MLLMTSTVDQSKPHLNPRYESQVFDKEPPSHGTHAIRVGVFVCMSVSVCPKINMWIYYVKKSVRAYV